MTANEVTTALSSLFSIAGIWWILFWLYRDYAVDQFRQDMVALRDELFDAAMGKSIEFSHPAYGLLRSTMNGFIRFGHRFTLTNALVIAFVGRGHIDEEEERSFPARWRKATSEISPETRLLLDRYRLRMHVLVLSHMLRSSPILVASVVVPLLAKVAVEHFLTEVLRVLRSPLDGIDSAALVEGQT